MRRVFMTAKLTKPVIGISCNYKTDENFSSHMTGERYIKAVVEVADAVPVLIPAIGSDMQLEGLLNSLDGILLTGGASNVEPHHYGGGEARDQNLIDKGRDAVAIPLVRRAVEEGVPLLGNCRGHQEINVAFGGSLHQYLHELDGYEDHRMERHLPMQERLRPRQRISVTPGGVLAKLNGGKNEAMVNTLHAQGVDRLGDGLKVEAVADDGTIEAISVIGAKTFALGVQWHSEWQTRDHPLYNAIFEAFGDASRTRMAVRLG
jgi:putative glutamine amidotransferase